MVDKEGNSFDFESMHIGIDNSPLKFKDRTVGTIITARKQGKCLMVNMKIDDPEIVIDILKGKYPNCKTEFKEKKDDN